MKLEDFIRSDTIGIRDNLDKINQKRSDVFSHMRSSEEICKRINNDISKIKIEEKELKEKFNSLDNLLNDINQELDNIEKKRQELNSSILEKQNEKHRLTKQISEREKTYKKNIEEINKVNEKKDKYEKESNHLTSDYDRNEENLNKILISSFNNYIKSVNSQIIQSYQTNSEISKKYKEVENLKQKRNTDPKIASLWEAREEWYSIIKSKSVPAVVNAAKRELKIIEDEINKLFPGALEVSGTTQMTNPIIDLYYRINEEGEIKLYLPFNESDWIILKNGGTQLSNKIISYFIWWLSSELSLNPESTKYNIENHKVILFYKIDYDERIKDSIRMQLEGNTGISFLFFKVPVELEKAFDYE